MADITMPQLGETVTEGTITKWMKGVGDRVEEDEILFEVSTDKVDSEVPSPTSGYVSEILVPEGDTVEIGARLAVISDSAPDGAAPAPAAAPAAAPASEPTAPPAVEAPPAPAPAEPAPAAVAETAPPPPPPPPPAPAVAPAPAASADGDSRVLSPVVRKLIAENGLDAASIEGTGAGGRITRADVLAQIDKQAAGGAPAAAPAAAVSAPAAAGPEPAVQVPRQGDEVVPFSNIRKRTAEHMVRSQITSAHTLVAYEVDYVGVERVRAVEKDQFRAEEGVGLTFLPFVIRAVVDAIREFPHLNASVGDNELIVHHEINMGIAVDLDFQGLIVPVIQGADGKRLRALAREVGDLAARARAKKLSADDIAGGTFTITNPGPFGTLITVPIINQPQVAILSTDGVRKKPVAIQLPDGSDVVAIHPIGNLALSFDHRAYDGAYASAFMAKVKEIIETRDWATEF